MNDVKQVLRYSVPGWVFILVFFIFLMITRFFLPPCLKNSFFNEFFLSLNLTDKVEDNSLLTAGGLLVSGIPLGFILSQFYYFFSNIFNDDMITMFLSMFQGMMLKMKEQGIVMKDPNDNTAINVKCLNKNHSIYFGYLTWHLRDKLGKDNENIIREQTLSDMSHGLGASLYSVALGFTIYSVLLSIYYYSYTFFSHKLLVYLLIAFGVNFVITAIMVLIFCKNRKNIALQQIIVLEGLVYKEKSDDKENPKNNQNGNNKNREKI